jgi:hypothetical protein
MIPWDLGIIKAIGKELGEAIFPSSPPEETYKTPYLIFELKNYMYGVNLRSRVEFSITIVDDREVTSASYDIMRAINKIICQKLTLSQGNSVIGTAKTKVDSVEKRKNKLTLNMIAMLDMEAIYENE